jgi:hypothetical protein
MKRIYSINHMSKYNSSICSNASGAPSNTVKLRRHMVTGAGDPQLPLSLASSLQNKVCWVPTSIK